MSSRHRDNPHEALGEIAEAADRIGFYMRVLREEERLEGGGLGVTYSVGNDVETIRAALTTARASLEAVEEGPAPPCPECPEGLCGHTCDREECRDLPLHSRHGLPLCVDDSCERYPERHCVCPTNFALFEIAGPAPPPDPQVLAAQERAIVAERLAADGPSAEVLRAILDEVTDGPPRRWAVTNDMWFCDCDPPRNKAGMVPADEKCHRCGAPRPRRGTWSCPDEHGPERHGPNCRPKDDGGPSDTPEPAPPPDPKPDYKGALWDLRGAVHAYLLACVLSGDPAVIGELRVDLTEADRTALRFLGGKGERDG